MFKWKTGQKTLMAQVCGMKKVHISEILHRKRRVSLKRAKELEAASLVVCGEIIPWQDWIQNETTAHPAFVSFGVLRKKKLNK